jgi:hypothetical protein
MTEPLEDTSCSPTSATGSTPWPGRPSLPSPKEKSLLLLDDLLIAWAEGELSEGAVSEITGMDRFTLRGMKQDAIDRALAYAGPILESNARRTVLTALDAMTPEERERFFALRPEWRSVFEQASRASPMTGGPSSRTCP